MVETSLVDPDRSFYDSLLPAIQEIDKRRGPLHLAVVVQFAEDGEDEWTLLVGSSRLSEMRTTAALELVARTLAAKAPEVVTRRIIRMGIIKMGEEVHRRVTSAITKPLNGVATVRDVKLSGFEVPKAGVFVAIRDLAKSSASLRRTPSRRKARG